MFLIFKKNKKKLDLVIFNLNKNRTNYILFHKLFLENINFYKNNFSFIIVIYTIKTIYFLLILKIYLILLKII
ncbi:hypothetical protein D9V65_01015 [Buchnera aphidicola (Anoecia oenotherae)]|uniref:Uncharacterized protein n=1 Tax=Buchnera aphidicola (Anoecia oenotherae) TaxID=1241833 RepID=A0A4D6Y4H8_9GAMM|nr:hypothetical protein D9V65_01015 [Buchnera aphidicola (Anoecia oenotherae)]